MKSAFDRIWNKISIVIVASVVMIALGSAVTAAPLPAPRHIYFNVANDAGAKYDWDYSRYSGLYPDGSAPHTYFIKGDGSGLNELHITNDITQENQRGQVTRTNEQSGVFYISNTGGRGFDNDIVLLLAVNGTIPDDFSVHIRSSGYNWTPATPGAYQPDPPTDYQYVDGGIDETFTKSDFIYGPQTWKPGAGDISSPSLPLYSGQNISDTSNGFQLMFIDLKVGNLYQDSTRFPGEFINRGHVKVEYSFNHLTTFATFNGYGWCSAAYQDEGISWTNAMSPVSGGGGSSPGSGYEVTGLPSAEFTSNVVSGNYPLTVQFTDRSTGSPTAWQWNFGDTSPNSTLQSPSHIYFSGGSYTVTLTAANAGGSGTMAKSRFILIPKILPGQTKQPTDPRHEGLYGDMNGNSRLDFNDLQVYFAQMTWIQSNEPVPIFDYNHNGRIDFNDLQVLFREL